MEVAEKNNAAKKTYSAKDYICNEYCFDGIENAGYGLHRDDITKWYDNNGNGGFITYLNWSYVSGNLFVMSNQTSQLEKCSQNDAERPFKTFDGDLTFECVYEVISIGSIIGGLYFSDPVITTLSPLYRFSIGYWPNNGIRVQITNDN